MDLAFAYVVGVLVAALAALIAGAVAAVVLRRVSGCEGGANGCPDGIGLAVPALAAAGVAALTVMGATAVLVSRRADARTVQRMSRHAMWLAVPVVAGPVLAWQLLAILSGNPLGFVGIAALAYVAVPLVVALYRPNHVGSVLAGCLVVPVLVLALWWRFVLLVPSAVLLAGCWTVALFLTRRAQRGAFE